MVGYFRADFKGAINHGETPSSCNDEMGVGMDESGVAWINRMSGGTAPGTSMATDPKSGQGFSS